MLEKWRLLWLIFLTFLKIGPITFGGGYAMIPVIEREVVDRRKWLRTHDITDIFAVAESVPGAIAINSATFIGYRIAGVSGAIAAMLGILFPTFCIIIVLSLFFMQMKDHPKIEAAFLSIRATIVALIAYAAYKIGKTAVVDKTTLTMIAITVGLLFLGHGVIHPVLIIVGGAIAGVIVVAIRNRIGLKTVLEKEEHIYDYMI
ncbi:chromate transporter [Paenibacillus sp. 1P07SE]|uniref:chromate transporter n=1 Tax=Paenibacillus sp. 1P07SE TaxID=3132209 RepID=UPI0039A73C27